MLVFLIVLGLILVLFLWSACIVSSRCSKIEEKIIKESEEDGFFKIKYWVCKYANNNKKI